MLYVKTTSPLEATGLASILVSGEFDNKMWQCYGPRDNAAALVINVETKTLSFLTTDNAAAYLRSKSSEDQAIEASEGWPAIKALLMEMTNPTVKVGDIVVFTYSSGGDITDRVVIVKEVDSKYIKGLDVLDDFAFKSFKRARQIKNLKQVKA